MAGVLPRTAALTPLLLAVPANARPSGWFPRKTGECGWVHGRYAVYNGSGVRRIWVVGTNHMLNLWDEDRDVPADLDVGFDKRLYGDFLVCAVEAFRPGKHAACAGATGSKPRFATLR
ncbi:MAG TPA: hypothetical protein VLM18_04320 [Croceibacterium sp.]|nr:hypothetical protein [Croceibacterium sp.]